MYTRKKYTSIIFQHTKKYVEINIFVDFFLCGQIIIVFYILWSYSSHWIFDILIFVEKLYFVIKKTGKKHIFFRRGHFFCSSAFEKMRRFDRMNSIVILMSLVVAITTQPSKKNRIFSSNACTLSPSLSCSLYFVCCNFERSRSGTENNESICFILLINTNIGAVIWQANKRKMDNAQLDKFLNKIDDIGELLCCWNDTYLYLNMQTK